MREPIHAHVDDLPRQHRDLHEGYEYYRRDLVPWDMAGQCTVALYEIPPGKSAYPYHYHVKNEETFYILRGQGILKTPDGERLVGAGEFVFFPANESGAHKLTNSSGSEMLVYLDFDTSNDLEVAFYPDSGKLGIWGKDINRLYRTDQSVDYYQGE